MTPAGNVQACDLEIVEADCWLGAYIQVAQQETYCGCENEISVNVVGGAPPYTYLWSNGMTTQNIPEICDGDQYAVTVVDSEGCSATAGVVLPCASTCSGYNSICVEVLESPVAQFSATPEIVDGVIEICEGQTIFFENESTGATRYTWDFGNSVSSSEVDVAYTYPSAGTYEVLLIARNDCYCSDSTSVTVIVADAISPQIDCAGTVCPREEITYTTDADCGTFNWTISSNGTVLSGGGLNDNYVTIDWGAGPEGIIELTVDDCNGDFCLSPLFEIIPIIDDNGQIVGPEKVCREQEAGYSITPYAGTEFIWSASALGTITSGQYTNEITVQWSGSLSAQPQWVAVEYDNCYLGCSGRDTIWIDILSEFFIEGPIEACPGEPSTFTTGDIASPTTIVNAQWTVLDASGTVVDQSVGASNIFTTNWNSGSGDFTVLADVSNPDDYCIEQYAIFNQSRSAHSAPARN